MGSGVIQDFRFGGGWGQGPAVAMAGAYVHVRSLPTTVYHTRFVCLQVHVSMFQIRFYRMKSNIILLDSSWTMK